MERKISFAPGEYYHIYNRGVEKRKIFLNESDYERFIKLLYLCNGTKQIVFRDLAKKDHFVLDVGEKIIAIGSYVLMPNHFHILVKAKDDIGITMFLRKLSTAYTMYFNKKNERVGPLFQGAFKAEHLNTDEYLKYIYSYIHLNPGKIIDSEWKENIYRKPKEIFSFIEKYPYSSFIDYINNERTQQVILSKDEFPTYFKDQSDLVESLTDWLTLT